MSREQLAFRFDEPDAPHPYTLTCADVLTWAQSYTGPKFHAMITDAPYELNFMSKDWDRSGIAFKPETWKALAQHLLPGAFIMAFASSRGFHRVMTAMEDAGLRLYPAIFGWLSGQSFPKATRISAQIDAAAGVQGEVIGTYQHPDGKPRNWEIHTTKRNGIYSDIKTDDAKNNREITAPATPLAQTWEGHRYGGQMLKNSLEPIIVASKPGICYNELQDIVADIVLLLGDLWRRFADTAETITRAESIVASVLSCVETTIAKSEAHISVDGVKKNLRDDQQKSEKVGEPTVPKNVRIYSQANGSTVITAKSPSIKMPLLCNPPSTDFVAEPAIYPTLSKVDIEPVNCAELNSPLTEPTATENTALINAVTDLNHDQCSKIHCETARDTDIRAAILRSISEKAKLDLSTIWLWSITWDALYDEVKSSTIATSEKTITVLKTLSLTLRRLMLATTTSEPTSASKRWSYASDVNSHFIGLLTCLMEQQPSVNHASLSPIIVAQVPYAGKPVDSIVTHGSGALNIDGGRIAGQWSGSSVRPCTDITGGNYVGWWRGHGPIVEQHASGRWPPNFAISHLDTCVQVGTRQVQVPYPPTVHKGISSIWGNGVDASSLRGGGYMDANGQETVADWDCAPQCPVATLDAQAGVRRNGGAHQQDYATPGIFGTRTPPEGGTQYAGDTGNASRFFHVSDWSLDVAEQLAQADPAFYCAKASRGERDQGLEGIPASHRMPSVGRRKCRRCHAWEWRQGQPDLRKCSCEVPDYEVIESQAWSRNSHPTVKPIALCRWLATLLLPPAAYAPRRLLVPFAGTGSEAIGALLAGWDEVVLVEQDASYVALAEQRLAYWSRRTAGGV